MDREQKTLLGAWGYGGWHRIFHGVAKMQEACSPSPRSQGGFPAGRARRLRRVWGGRKLCLFCDRTYGITTTTTTTTMDFLQPYLASPMPALQTLNLENSTFRQRTLTFPIPSQIRHLHLGAIDIPNWPDLHNLESLAILGRGLVGLSQVSLVNILRSNANLKVLVLEDLSPREGNFEPLYPISLPNLHTLTIRKVPFEVSIILLRYLQLDAIETFSIEHWTPGNQGDELAEALLKPRYNGPSLLSLACSKAETITITQDDSILDLKATQNATESTSVRIRSCRFLSVLGEGPVFPRPDFRGETQFTCLRQSKPADPRAIIASLGNVPSVFLRDLWRKPRMGAPSHALAYGGRTSPEPLER